MDPDWQMAPLCRGLEQRRRWNILRQVNSGAESQTLTPLKAAERTRLGATQSSAACAVCLSLSVSVCVCESEREREAAHVALMRHTFSIVTYTKQVCAHCSGSLPHFLLLGFLMPQSNEQTSSSGKETFICLKCF